MTTMLLAQAQDALETAKAVGGLPTSALLALVCLGLAYVLNRLDGKLDRALAANDSLQDERIKDLKQTIKDLGGAHKEAA